MSAEQRENGMRPEERSRRGSKERETGNSTGRYEKQTCEEAEQVAV
jgi:hypothetical protein